MVWFSSAWTKKACFTGFMASLMNVAPHIRTTRPVLPRRLMRHVAARSPKTLVTVSEGQPCHREIAVISAAGGQATSEVLSATQEIASHAKGRCAGGGVQMCC